MLARRMAECTITSEGEEYSFNFTGEASYKVNRESERDKREKKKKRTTGEQRKEEDLIKQQCNQDLRTSTAEPRTRQ